MIEILAEEGEINPVFLILFIVGIIAVTFLAMKSESKKAIKKIKKQYEGRIIEEGTFGKLFAFLTTDELVIQNNQNSFKVFKLSDIGYVVSKRDLTLRTWAFGVLDFDKNGLKGELVGGTRAARALNHATLFVMPSEEANKLCDMIMRNYNGIKKMQ